MERVSRALWHSVRSLLRLHDGIVRTGVQHAGRELCALVGAKGQFCGIAAVLVKILMLASALKWIFIRFFTFNES